MILISRKYTQYHKIPHESVDCIEFTLMLTGVTVRSFIQFNSIDNQ